MEPDVDYDHDSTFGGDRDSLRSDSTSLASEVTRYPEAHGRRYHAYNAGKYLFPNDEQELNRMDIEHHNQRLQLDGRLHLAPLDNPQQILDIGTGTGIWAIEMSDEYPGAEVIGTDLSPVQPTWLPPNCRFEVDDFEQEWTYGSNRFDFIHARFLLGSVSDYPTLYAQIYKALKPGGWFEISDMEIGTFSDDGSVTPDMPSVRWWNYLQEAFTRMGKPMIACARYAELMKEAGLVNVHSRLLKRPTNDWPKDPRMKEIGRFTCLNFLEGIEGFTVAAFTSQLGWSREEVEVFLAQVRKESMKRSIHGWQKGVVAYGQKPPDPLKTSSTTTASAAAAGYQQQQQ